MSINFCYDLHVHVYNTVALHLARVYNKEGKRVSNTVYAMNRDNLITFKTACYNIGATVQSQCQSFYKGRGNDSTQSAHVHIITKIMVSYKAHDHEYPYLDCDF